MLRFGLVRVVMRTMLRQGNRAEAPWYMGYCNGVKTISVSDHRGTTRATLRWLPVMSRGGAGAGWLYLLLLRQRVLLDIARFLPSKRSLR